MTKDPPFSADIAVEAKTVGSGFDTPDLMDPLRTAFFDANKEVFGGNEPLFVGCGGGIPFMQFLAESFPGVSFLLTGVGFPDCNAHAANENLDLEFCRKLITTLALTLSKL